MGEKGEAAEEVKAEGTGMSILAGARALVTICREADAPASFTSVCSSVSYPQLSHPPFRWDLISPSLDVMLGRISVFPRRP